MSNSKFSNDMFESLKNKLKNDQNDNKTSDILKLKPGNEYIVRLVPNIKDPSKSIFKQFFNTWVSVKSGQRIFNVSPQTYGQPCPINEEFLKLYNDENEAIKNKGRPLSRKVRWLTNVYVVDDPVTPENNGKVMVLSYSKQLNAVIEDGLFGEESSDVGMRAFDLSEEGCNLRIKVEPQGEITNLSSSKFKNPSKIPGMTPKKIDEIHESAHDLEQVFNIKSYDELKKILVEHFYGSEVPEEDNGVTTIDTSVAEEVVDTVNDDLVDEITFDDED